MQTRTQRGRAVPTRRSSLRYFYVMLGAIAVIAVGVGIYAVTRPAASFDSRVSLEQAVRPLSAPSGTTAEGFAYKGNPDAPVKVIEYADYQCPACANAFRSIAPMIDQQYVETGKIQIIYHDFPLPQHGNAVPAAAAARCAGAQDKYWPMHDLLFSRQREWTNDSNVQLRFQSYARELALDQTAFNSCQSDQATVSAIQAAVATGQQAGVSSTPTYVVNGTAVTADGLQAAIDTALAAQGS